jgi:hypothetical protein
VTQTNAPPRALNVNNISGKSISKRLLFMVIDTKMYCGVEG